MEPRQAGQGLSQESQPHGPYEAYQAGGEVYRDQQIESSPERHEIAPAGVEQGATQPVVPSLPTPVLTPSADDATATATAADDSALLAADDDLIEKEWVDKAKKIIQETKDDPYTREREVTKLQIEYIRKRYGRIIGNPSDQG